MAEFIKPILLFKLHSDFSSLWASFKKKKSRHSEQVHWHRIASNHSSRVCCLLFYALSTCKSIKEAFIPLLHFIKKFALRENTELAQLHLACHFHLLPGSVCLASFLSVKYRLLTGYYQEGGTKLWAGIHSFCFLGSPLTCSSLFFLEFILCSNETILNLRSTCYICFPLYCFLSYAFSFKWPYPEFSMTVCLMYKIW